MVNVELMQKVLDHITAHPKEWNQASWANRWSCGTSFCFAGHAANMTGHNFIWDFDGGAIAVEVEAGTRAFEVERATRASEVEGNVAIALAAREELGLTVQQAAVLFNGDNSLAELYYLANVITDGAISIPEGYPCDRARIDGMLDYLEIF